MGAASKGIIQRGYQHNATVYKAPYAKNPFDSVTDDELKEYKRTVERKRAGDCKYELIYPLDFYEPILILTIFKQIQIQIFRNQKPSVHFKFLDKSRVRQ